MSNKNSQSTDAQNSNRSGGVNMQGQPSTCPVLPSSKANMDWNPPVAGETKFGSKPTKF